MLNGTDKHDCCNKLQGYNVIKRKHLHRKRWGRAQNSSLNYVIFILYQKLLRVNYQMVYYS